MELREWYVVERRLFRSDAWDPQTQAIQDVGDANMCLAFMEEREVFSDWRVVRVRFDGSREVVA